MPKVLVDTFNLKNEIFNNSIYYLIEKRTAQTIRIEKFDFEKGEFIHCRDLFVFKERNSLGKLIFVNKKNKTEHILIFSDSLTKEYKKKIADKEKKRQQLIIINTQLNYRFGTYRNHKIKIPFITPDKKRYKVNILDSYFIGVPGNRIKIDDRFYSISVFDIDYDFIIRKIKNDSGFFKALLSFQKKIDYDFPNRPPTFKENSKMYQFMDVLGTEIIKKKLLKK